MKQSKGWVRLIFRVVKYAGIIKDEGVDVFFFCCLLLGFFLWPWLRRVTADARHGQNGHHSRVLHGEERADHRRHGLHGQGAAGEAAALVSRHQSGLRARTAQSGSISERPHRRHDQLQGEFRASVARLRFLNVWESGNCIINMAYCLKPHSVFCIVVKNEFFLKYV